MVAIGCENGVWTASRHDPQCIWLFHLLCQSSHSRHPPSDKTFACFKEGDSMRCTGRFWYLPRTRGRGTGSRFFVVGLPLITALGTSWLPHRRAFDTITIRGSKRLADIEKRRRERGRAVFHCRQSRWQDVGHLCRPWIYGHVPGP